MRCVQSISGGGGVGENLLVLGMSTFITQTAFSLAICYYAHEASIRINLFAMEAYSSRWYKFAVAEQRAILMTLKYGQQEIRFTGFHIISCSMETFAMVGFFNQTLIFTKMMRFFFTFRLLGHKKWRKSC